MSNPFFSIIVPVYNVENYLKKCLDSIIQQVFDDYEVILIDDGSNDNSLQICEIYASLNKRFKVLTQKNTGVSGARNKGIFNALGKYMWFVDADDYIEENALQKLGDCLKGKKIDMLGFSNYHFFEENNKINKNSINPTTKILSPKVFFEQGNVFETTPWIMVIKTSLIKDNDICFDTELVIYEDNLFMMNCLAKAKLIKYMDDFLYYYLIRKDSLTSKNKSQKIRMIGYLKLLDFSMEAIQNSDYKDYWNENIYNLHNSIYELFFKMNLEEREEYNFFIKKMRTNKLKMCKNDVLGVKMLKFSHNYCFPLYKSKIFKS